MSAASVIAGRAYVLIEAIDKSQRVIRGVGRALKRLKMLTQPLKHMLRILDQVGKRLREIGRGFSQLGSKLQGAGFRSIMGGLAMGVPIHGAINQAKDYSDAILGLQAVLGKTKDEMRSLDDLIRKLGATTSYTSAEIAMSAQELARGGFSGNEIEDSIQSVLNLARAGQVDLTSASKSMVRAIRAFNMEASDATRVSDAFFEASRQGTSTVYELQSALSFSAGTASQMGLSLEQTLGILSKMANQMLVGTKGGTSLNQMLLRLGTRSRVVKAQLGFDVFDPESGEVKDALELFQGINNALKSMSKQKGLEAVESIFNVRGARAAMVLKQFNDVEDAIEAVENSQGESAKAAETMDSGIGGSIRRILSAFNNLAIAFGSTFAAPLQKVEEKLIPVLEGLGKWVQQHADLGRKVLIFVGGLLALGAALFSLGIAAKLVGVAFIGFGTIVSAVSFLGPLIAKLVLIGGILKGMQYLPGDIGKAFQSLESVLFETFSDIWEVAKNAFMAIKDLILSGNIEGAMNVLMVSLNSIFELAWVGLKKSWLQFTFFLKRALINAVGGIKVAWNEMQGWLSKAILDFVADNKLLNWAFEKYSGVNMQEERERAKQLGNDPDMAKNIIDSETQRQNEAIIAEQNKKLRELTQATNKLRDKYEEERKKAKDAANRAIKTNMYRTEDTNDLAGRMVVAVLPAGDEIGSKMSQSVASGRVEGLEQGSTEALNRAQDNQKKMADGIGDIASGVNKTNKILDERLPEQEGVG